MTSFSQSFAGYQNLYNEPIESTPIGSSAQARSPSPDHWEYNSSDVWSTSSSYEITITAFGEYHAKITVISLDPPIWLGAYPSQPYYPAPLPGGQTASLQNQIYPYYYNTATTSSPDRLNLAPRPRDWRRDYKVRSAISSIFPRRQQNLSSERGVSTYTLLFYFIYLFTNHYNCASAN
jgi:hypothetical protein